MSYHFDVAMRKVESFLIEACPYAVTAQEIAEDTRVSLHVVRDCLRRLVASTWAEEKPADGARVDGCEVPRYVLGPGSGGCE